MTIPDLNELADRVEALSGPDREVDRAIMELLGLKPDYSADWGPRDNCRPAPFAYTASLDAAMMLVPEGWFIRMAAEDRHSHSWRWDLRGGLGFERSSRAATPALALTAAALRARSAVQS